MSQTVIKVRGLSKEYVVAQGQRAHGTFYDLLTHGLKAPFRKFRPAVKVADEESKRFWALRDVEFDVKRGEVVGVIGRNGAGKSTLLKILSRITAPTKGRIEVRGRLASLLEVGTGFHAELSGRENIYLNGAILGMTRAEVARKFDEIVAFAEVDRFIDTPVKRYSSGMYVRLAFGVAAHLEVDVLLVDEVLAVGDAAFQDKCLAKMQNISSGGRTVLFVSHNQGAISRLCNRGVVLDGGEVKFAGPVTDALALYGRSSAASTYYGGVAIDGPLSTDVILRSIDINGTSGGIVSDILPSTPMKITAMLGIGRTLPGFRVRFEIHKGGLHVFSIYDQSESNDVEAGAILSEIDIPSWFLSPGDYHVNLVVYSSEYGCWARMRSTARFVVTPEWGSCYRPDEAMGVININGVGSRRFVKNGEV